MYGLRADSRTGAVNASGVVIIIAAFSSSVCRRTAASLLKSRLGISNLTGAVPFCTCCAHIGSTTGPTGAVGCGTGFFTFGLLNTGSAATAVVPTMATARARSRRRIIHRRYPTSRPQIRAPLRLTVLHAMETDRRAEPSARSDAEIEVPEHPSRRS
jgi:hypothetical protein